MRARSTLALTLSALLFAVLSIHTPTVAEEKVTVPLEEVVKTTGECELTSAQWSQSEVTVPLSCVSEDYLEAHGHNVTTQEEGTATETSGTGNTSFTIDQICFGQLDGDPEIEMGTVDNKSSSDGEYVLFTIYPAGEEDGNLFNKTFRIENGRSPELECGNMDEDERDELMLLFNSTNGDNNYVLTGDYENGDLRIENYKSPHGRRLIDGQIFKANGEPLVTVDEEINFEDLQHGLYQLEDGLWKLFSYKDVDMEKIIERWQVEAKRYPYNEKFRIFAISDDGDEMITTVNDEHIRFRHLDLDDGIVGKLDAITAGIGGKILDIGYTNIEPWKDKEKEFYAVGPDKMKEFVKGKGFWRGRSWYEQGGKKMVDFHLLSSELMLSEEAVEAEGSLKWTSDYWIPEYGKTGNWVGVTKDGRVITSWGPNFNNEKPFDLDFSIGDFYRDTKDFENKTISLS